MPLKTLGLLQTDTALPDALFHATSKFYKKPNPAFAKAAYSI
jgi:hypothetical protein